MGSCGVCVQVWVYRCVWGLWVCVQVCVQVRHVWVAVGVCTGVCVRPWVCVYRCVWGLWVCSGVRTGEVCLDA